MKQLLIVKSGTSLNGGATNAKDLSGMAAGSIGFFKLSDYTWLSDKATENFGIALGGGSGKMPFIIPEVDVNTLTVTKASYDAGSVYAASITIPSPSAGKTYTLVLVKLGTGINGERNKWSQVVSIPIGGSSNANTVAAKMRDGFTALAEAGAIDVTVTGSNAVVTITGKNKNDKWMLVAADDLYGTAITTTTTAVPAVGDKAYVEKLARECAGNKGFTNTDGGSEIYPGYPEAVENVNYNIYNLRFATKRDAGKQTDERIWQYVHIAIPSSITATVINKILVSSELPNAPVAASNG